MEVEVINLYTKEIPEITALKEILEVAQRIEKVENICFNVIFVDNEKIQELNRVYRKIDRPTDVISFALEDHKDVVLPIRLLGDIYISIPKAEEQAKEYGHSFKRELCFLGIHGFLHLLGYDHMTKEDEEVMFAKQEVILDEYGI